ncbi:glucose-1-phosphate thymidylyltransferase homolog [Methanothermobacter thermautotrophicus str. Delta H]|uniref:Bifunctional protein GlmU n=1 Tax=Methanothermobacter thermautotrophicus (strain ATCC 29096 / DSM 1053 / JCM 10044 / NBRC 100330 / Delta H) TaxID=187420 RepID=O27626_METTH|nr:bifunctional sugar-1-phosphate nucleotidylyltransferase/acetyltransferase [Methanothermobacter thermautotrophicus]AAB86062.1 glucose-1-phosphate thymidylyltransferase homolog [Methanothermobacter thermautotrophicus str. Delta H]WBF06085.1 NTP transferase domain-containing protein [Methanothermobacter thermautotrophicus]HOQ17885.1 sugar phosphate nucleotidyltransferase [Methanothermobacter thermautotrophicus]
MQAVILTAGEGTRMRPLTLTRPKTMLPVAGKPILQYSVDALRDNGVHDIVMITGYHEEAVRSHFGDGSGSGVNITYVRQEERLGTAHAIGQASELIDDEFIVLNGDIITDPGLMGDLIGSYHERKPETLMVLREVPDPSSFGVVKVEGDRVREIIEKPGPDAGAGNLINTGIYVFSPAVFDYIERTPLSRRGEYEITDTIMMQVRDDLPVRAIISDRDWIDVGRPWELLEASERLMKDLEDSVEGDVEDGVTIHGPVAIGEGTIIRSGTYIQGPVYIGRNCDIGPNSYLRAHTCIGDGVSIGNAVEVKNSIIMDGTNINHLSYVGDSVIGMNCNIAAGTNIANLRFDDGPVRMVVKDDVVETGRRKLGAVFGDGVKTGINSSFNPGVKVGKDSCIGAGCVISRDVPSDRLVILRQEHTTMEYR